MSLLPEIPAPDGFAKPQGSSEPMFWIREIRFLSSWKKGKTEEIRRIKFKKGLNVVWSPPPEVNQVEQRLSGHASGKTTLCRLIRYMFDEPKMGNENFRQSVNHKFVEGFVVASVRLDGESWCLARPFSALTMPGGCAARCDDLDKFLCSEEPYGSYADFRKALEDVAKRIVPVSELPSGEKLTSRHFFPWFSRDQECHFSRIHDWRMNTTSETDSPLLNQTEKAIVMRSVYEPDIFKEVELSARQSKLNASIKGLVKQQETFASICSEKLRKIREHRMADIPDEASELFVAMAKDRLDEEIKVARANPPDVQDRLDRLADAMRNAEQNYQNLATAYNATVNYVEALKTEIGRLKKDSRSDQKKDEEELPPLSRVKLISQSMPDREYCCVPRSIAHKRGCFIGDEEEFSQDPYAAAEARAVIREERNKTIDEKRQDYAESYKIAQREYRKVEFARQVMEDAGKRFKNETDAAVRDSQDRVSALTVIKNAVNDYDEYLRKLSTAHDDVKQKRDEHKEVSESLSSIRKAAKGRYGINDCFAQIIKFVLGSSVVGKVVETGGDITFDTEFHDAAYDSAALNEVETIAFDLAVMTLSIQGEATHPRFLIHDGPRVSDLTEAIYRRYFDYAKYLEDRAGGDPNFQYIITTTTPPPEELQKEPYLRLKLDSSTPEGRLLKCDLN